MGPGFGTLTITISGQVAGNRITGTGGGHHDNTDNGTQMVAFVKCQPDCYMVLVNGTGQASISTTGLVTAIAMVLLQQGRQQFGDLWNICDHDFQPGDTCRDNGYGSGGTQ
jgi:hypothetical protein